VIDPEPIAFHAADWYFQEHAEYGIDYTAADITNVCAISLLAGTPIAYLPERLDILDLYRARILPRGFPGFAPAELLQKVGGLDGAKVLAARAHAMFDVKNRHPIESMTPDFFMSPLREVVFREILSTARVFDTENQTSVEVLNSAADVLASSMPAVEMVRNIQCSEPLVKEFSSRDIDLIQAADMAAGWAGICWSIKRFGVLLVPSAE